MFGRELGGAPCKKGLLGNVQLRQNGAISRVVPTAASTVKQTVIDLSAENDPEPQAVIVTLYRHNIEAVPANAEPFYIRARITWGTGKASQQVLLDYHHGTRICVDASSLRVDAEYVCENDPGPTVQCGASIVYGNIGTQATLTHERVGINAGATSSFVDLPDFSRELTLLTSNAAASVAAHSVLFSSDKGASVIVQNVLPNVALKIPNGVEAYAITNNAAGAATFWAIFGLFI